MNEEKTLLIQKCYENPVLRVIVKQIASTGASGQWVRVKLDDLSRGTGLADSRCRKAVGWLLRKGFLVCSLEGPFPQRGGRYRLDPELHEAIRELDVRRFGELGKKIIGSFTIDNGRYRMVVLSFGSNGQVGDEYGTPLCTAEARDLLVTLEAYVKVAEAWGDIEWEKHRQSRSNLSPWGDKYSTYRGKPPALVCFCTECKNDYERALTVWANFDTNQKQEQKTIRGAMKELV